MSLASWFGDEAVDGPAARRADDEEIDLVASASVDNLLLCTASTSSLLGPHLNIFMSIHAIVRGNGVMMEAATGTTDAMSLFGSLSENPRRTMAIPVFCMPVSILIAMTSRTGKLIKRADSKPPANPIHTHRPADKSICHVISLNMYKLAYVPKMTMKMIIEIDTGASMRLQTCSRKDEERRRVLTKEKASSRELCANSGTYPGNTR